MPNGTNITNVDPNAIGATVANPNASAVSGFNNGITAAGLIAGPEPIFKSPVGVFGRSLNVGVFGFSDKSGDGTGVAGNTNAGTGTGVHGHTSTGVGVLGTSDSSGPAGKFIGNLECTGHVNCSPTSTISCFDVNLIGGDCAEEFDLAETKGVSPGTVMVIDNAGSLRASREPYDKRVAGVISGAGNHKPGIILDKRTPKGNRQAIALVGKVCCKADAEYGAIEVGDLLTTSRTPGHAMKVTDPLRGFGSVVGKALQPLAAGQGLIAILVALQ
jgi:hypothetical protein